MINHPHPLPFKLILGSASPRRKELLLALGYNFEIQTQAGEEDYPPSLRHHEITDYLAIKKARELTSGLSASELLLTADTIVWQDQSVLGKPKNLDEARDTLIQLSGKWHEVITSVCFTTPTFSKVYHEVTRVQFGVLTLSVINNYLESGNPLDKAGAYGIQEWIGLVGVTSIEGSYTNVVGLPTALVYNTLQNLALQWEMMG